MWLGKGYLGTTKRTRFVILLQYHSRDLVFWASSHQVPTQAPCRYDHGDQWLVGYFSGWWDVIGGYFIVGVSYCVSRLS